MDIVAFGVLRSWRTDLSNASAAIRWNNSWTPSPVRDETAQYSAPSCFAREVA